jgi:hypothetical protein
VRNTIVSCACAALLLAGVFRGAAADTGKLEISVRDKKSAQIMPCRIHLKDAAGKPQRPDKLPFFRDHFVCEGTVSLPLAAGNYSYEIERGPEYSRSAGTITVKENAPASLKVELERLADLPAEGYWPGELHVHRSLDDIELLMRAEDLHVAPVITWWNSRNQWSSEKRLPEKLLHQFDTNRYYHIMAGEDEREGGALLFCNLPQPLAITGASREYPAPVKFLSEARTHKNVWVDIEKPFWWDVPVWLASGQVDSIGLANNHMCRSQMSELEAWGKPRDRERLPPPRGNGYWTQEIYYHILNCGIRLPPSAGSASGVLPNPVGYNRVYVHTGPKDFDYDHWWEGLRAGRCFVTNGPLLRVEAAGKLPGHVFTAPQGQEVQVDVKARLTTRDPIRFVEIIKNGQVERKVPFADWSKTGSLGTVTFQESGWFLVRAITEETKTFRFASTGPYYVEVGANKKPVSKASAQFFLDWVRERAKRVKLDDAGQRDEVLQSHRAAEKFWEQKVAEGK